MPAKSKEQQRLFGMVHAYQKGELKNPSKEIKDVAKSISYDDAKDFAETKHKGLPNKVKKSTKITESRLRKIISESIKNILKEGLFNPAYVIIDGDFWYIGDGKDVSYLQQSAAAGELNRQVRAKMFFSYDKARAWAEANLSNLKHEEDTYGTEW